MTKMSHWNHRVFKETLDDGEVWYSVREVFYNDDGGIYAHMETPVDIAAESIDALREYLEWCLKSLDQPILEVGKIKFESDDITEEDLKNSKGFDNMDDFLDDLHKESEITGIINTGDEKIMDWNINTDDLENLAGSIK
jgi:hypothetical protein